MFHQAGWFHLDRKRNHSLNRNRKALSPTRIVLGKHLNTALFHQSKLMMICSFFLNVITSRLAYFSHVIFYSTWSHHPEITMK